MVGVDKDLVLAPAHRKVGVIGIEESLFFNPAVFEPVDFGLPAGIAAEGVFGVHFYAHYVILVGFQLFGCFWRICICQWIVWLEHFVRRADADFRAVGIEQGVVEVLADLPLVVFGVDTVVFAAHGLHADLCGRGRVGAGGQQAEAAEQGGAGGKFHIGFLVWGWWMFSGCFKAEVRLKISFQ